MSAIDANISLHFHEKSSMIDPNTNPHLCETFVVIGPQTPSLICTSKPFVSLGQMDGRQSPGVAELEPHNASLKWSFLPYFSYSGPHWQREEDRSEPIGQPL